MAADYDITPHLKTWKGFIRIFIGTAIPVAILLILMMIFLTNNN